MVVDSFDGNGHCSYFCFASSPNFLSAQEGFSARMPIDVTYVGFQVRMQGCITGGAGMLQWRLYDAADTFIESGAVSIVGGCPNSGAAEQRYVGVERTNGNFRRIEFFRRDGVRMLVDDLQYGPVASLTTAPSSRTGAWRANFEDAPLGGAPFVSGDLAFTGNGQAVNNFIGIPHAGLFGGLGSPANFLLGNLSFSAQAPEPVIGLRAVLSGSNCSGTQLFDIESFDGAIMVDSAVIQIPGVCGTELSLKGLRPGTRLRVQGSESGNSPAGLINFWIDDLALYPAPIFESGFE
jgi:hypothetical protein